MRILLSGFGVVGRSVVQLLEEQRASLYSKHGLSPSFVGVIDSKGAAIDPRGLDTAQLLETKEKKGSVGALPAHGVRDAKECDIIAESEAQLLIEATPTTVRTPGPALERLKAAFRTGKHVICVNKAPLAVAFPALQELSRHNLCQFRYSGTVGGGTPVLALAEEVTRGSEVVAAGVHLRVNRLDHFVVARPAIAPAAARRGVLAARAAALAVGLESLRVVGLQRGPGGRASQRSRILAPAVGLGTQESPVG